MQRFGHIQTPVRPVAAELFRRVFEIYLRRASVVQNNGFGRLYPDRGQNNPAAFTGKRKIKRYAVG